MNLDTTVAPRRRETAAPPDVRPHLGSPGVCALHRARRALPRLAGLGGSVAVFAVLLVPVLGFLLVALTPRLFGQGDARFTLAPFATALRGNNLQALLNTAVTGVASALVATAFGTVLALLFGRAKVFAAPVCGWVSGRCCWLRPIWRHSAGRDWSKRMVCWQGCSAATFRGFATS
ncbi:hypothetical protein AB0878_25495 [Amycolatopsis sp. NPDC047767]|uniref:hypothetical protein n=1 Tax=Amycolatopsis sp. NPDC047767 TaxID=3156765 RepID=UPI00345473D7